MLKKLFFAASLISLTLGCGRAATLSNGQYSGIFSLQTPNGWTETQNRKSWRNYSLVLESPNNCCVIQVEILNEGADSASRPLEVVAELYAVGRGRHMGMQSNLIANDQILVDNREARAITVSRVHGPVVRYASSVFIRTNKGLAVLTLTWIPEASLESIAIWERVLDSFSLPTASRPEQPPFEPMVTSEQLELEVDLTTE
jgi:hypothetical protein